MFEDVERGSGREFSRPDNYRELSGPHQQL